MITPAPSGQPSSSSRHPASPSEHHTASAGRASPSNGRASSPAGQPTISTGQPSSAAGGWSRLLALGRRIHRGLSHLADFLLPPLCPLCERPLERVHTLCPSCMADLPLPSESLCTRCGRETWALPDLPSETEESDPSAPGDTEIPADDAAAHGEIFSLHPPMPDSATGCDYCRDEWYGVDRLLLAYSYDSTVAELIRQMKYADRSEQATLLGELLWQRIGGSLHAERPERVIPIPLHNRRLLKRRFNQSALLAGVLAKRLSIPLDTRSLQRTRHTPQQAALNREERQKNVAGAFSVDTKKARLLTGKTVLLLDDVFTTGATLNAAAETLRKAGAGRIVAACIAHTPPSDSLTTS